VNFMPSMAAGRGGDVESREARNWSENGSIKTNKGVNFVDSYRSQSDRNYVLKKVMRFHSALNAFASLTGTESPQV
ncbi:hypothetical protein, partial [Affinibrenneria salicis]|uniref:hypothetical protein n=1 Tax=Affinibrenneria salicis TaxID=2590031 RepID=UPI001CC7EE73